MPLVLTARSTAGVRAPPPLRLESGAAVIGRDPASQMWLDDPQVSSRHCTIAQTAAGWQLHDSSTNGTLINGRRAAGQQLLREGDVIAIADYELRVSLSGASQPEATQAPPDQVRAAAAVPPPLVTVTPHTAGGDPLLSAALQGLCALAATRRKARADLGVATDPAGDAFASPRTALASVQGMAPAQASAAIARLCSELEGHDKALLEALQAAFHHALGQFSPEAIKQGHRGDADAWKAYELAFAGSEGFVETFSKAFAEAYAKGIAKP